ncbi:MAG: cytochrome c5 family protein [Gammaproteobacteria bacterium]|nr:cytochrome c5 family protein [Gammaproteobacteria bacterium]MYF39046.1 cytochrome c5 family protein [Gammaproteobacteria bacterium]
MLFIFLRGATIRTSVLTTLVCLTLLVLVSCSRGSAPTNAPVVVQEARSGEEIYRKYCSNCHQGGIVESPVFGKKEDWEDRIEKGREALIANVRDGMPPGMPKMGNCPSCTIEELGNAVDYMLAALEDEQETEEENTKAE